MDDKKKPFKLGPRPEDALWDIFYPAGLEQVPAEESDEEQEDE